MTRIFPLINIFLITAVSFFGVDTIYKIFAAKLDIVDWHKPTISKNSFGPVEIDAPPFSHYSAIVQRDIFQTRSDNSVAKVEKIILEER